MPWAPSVLRFTLTWLYVPDGPGCIHELTRDSIETILLIGSSMHYTCSITSYDVYNSLTDVRSQHFISPLARSIAAISNWTFIHVFRYTRALRPIGSVTYFSFLSSVYKRLVTFLSSNQRTGPGSRRMIHLRGSPIRLLAAFGVPRLRWTSSWASRGRHRGTLNPITLVRH
jgi:hypothetical protein